jgi:hypothetical protein
MAVTCTLTNLICYYQELRGPFITSSVTMGTFLFTMKSFVIQTMKRDLYDKDEYQEQIAQRRKEGKKNDTYYGQLNRLRALMLWAIIVAFFNAGIQVLYGDTDQEWVAWACFVVTGVSWALVIACLMVVSHNLKEMIVISEAIAQRKERGSN